MLTYEHSLFYSLFLPIYLKYIMIKKKKGPVKMGDK